LTRGKSENNLAAAAPGSPVTHEARLEQGDAVAAFRQMQCGGTPGNAAAEHCDVRFDGPAQRLAVSARAAGRRDRDGGIIRTGGWIGQTQDGFFG